MKKAPVFHRIITISVLALLTACTPHLNKAQCENINWYQMGYSDGSHDKPQRDLTNFVTDCAKFHIAVDQRMYIKGWKAGVKSFCQPQNGYNLGTQGSTFNAICPKYLAKPFQKAYFRGLKKFCITTSGYTMGRSGAAYPQACKPSYFPAFANAYNEGKSRYNQIANLQSQLDSVNSQINAQNNTIKKNNSVIAVSYTHLTLPTICSV